MKDRIENYYKKSVKNPIIVIYNSANHMIFIDSKKPNIDLPEKFYFSLGSMNPNKNFEAIVNLAKNNPNDFFIISGKSHKSFNKTNLETLQNLIFTGYLMDEEIKYLYEKCEAFLFPSIYEGFGIPPLEAITCGCKCVICNDIPVLKEVYAGMTHFIDFNKIENIGSFKQIDNSDNLKKYNWKASGEKIFNSFKE